MTSSSTEISVDWLRLRFPLLKLVVVSTHAVELSHPERAQPILCLNLPYQDAQPEGSVRMGPQIQRFHMRYGAGWVEESNSWDDEDSQWLCPWEVWVHGWCLNLASESPNFVRPGKTADG